MKTPSCLVLCLFLLSPSLRAAENVVLITLDTTRADALSCYGQKDGHTPELDALASRSTLFRNAYTPVPQTLPAHASLMTGLYPFHHGVRDNSINILAESQITLAELFKDQGYSTGAVVAAVVLNRRFGLDQGFDLYDDAIKASTGERKADEVTRLALEMLKRLKPPFFLWIHYYDPHYPYEPPKDVHAPAPYLGEVAFMDRELGTLLKTLDLAHTLIIAVGDHGESLLEHGELEHGLLLYEPDVRVPLLLHLPGQTERAEVRETVSSAGIAATLAAALNWKAPPSFDVQDLRSADPGRSVYLETFYPFYSFGWSPLRGLLLDGHKFITSTSGDELYAVFKDPREKKDLTAKDAGRAQTLKKALAEACPEKGFGIKQSRPPQVDAELQKQLQSLGYISGTFLNTNEIGSQKLPHPKDLADVSQFIFETGPRLLAKNDTHGVLAGVKDILKRDPRNVPAMTLAGLTYWQTQNFERALDIFSECLKIAPTLYYIEADLGRSYFFLNRYAEAESHLKKALDLNPQHPESYLYLFETYFAQGNREAAFRVLEDAEARGIRHPRLLFNRGVFLMEGGKCGAAMPYLQEALHLNPENIEIIGNAAFCLQQMGQELKAWDMIQKGLALRPQDQKLLKFAFGLALGLGREGEAKRIAVEFVRLFPGTEETRRMRQMFPDLP